MGGATAAAGGAENTPEGSGDGVAEQGLQGLGRPRERGEKAPRETAAPRALPASHLSSRRHLRHVSSVPSRGTPSPQDSAR